tara:strand:+ start:76 stop:558 length:483 start_codon:yes stop_codon:yes gene_type:complete
MSIGKQRIGMMFMNFRSSISNGLGSIATSKTVNISAVKSYNEDGISAENLPRAPHSVYRKRPVKLVYDKNDFHMFRLPSEKNFLFSSYDYEDVFGQRKGINHSPHIRAQMNLDTNIVWAAAIIFGLGLVIENKRTHDFVTLRKNYLNSDMGWFQDENDFN